MTTILNNKTILKPGHLVKTTQNHLWGSTKYWSTAARAWQDIPVGSPALIISISIDNLKVSFLYQDSLYHIDNCYNDGEGIPYWCQIINE
jgi:hypothetical protein